MATNAQLSGGSCEHGSPPTAVDLTRYVLGGIDLDPCSSAYWQAFTTKATTYYDRASDGLKSPWFGRVFVNPPGGNKEQGERSQIKPFWNRLVDHWLRGAIDGACWLSFSLEQLCVLQSEPTHPLMLPTLIFCERLDYLRRPPTGSGPPKPGGAPTHGSAMTLLPSRRDPTEARAQLQRFRDRGSSLGAIVRPF